MADNQKTTLAMILLAGNESTAGQLDPLLETIQGGIDGWQGDDIPNVYCMYHRGVEKRGTGSPETHWYPIEKSTLEFVTGGWLNIDTYPPDGAAKLTGDLAAQVLSFLKELAQNHLPSKGPIHLIFAAHGKPMHGFHPTQWLLLFLRQLPSLFRILWRPTLWQSTLQNWGNSIHREVTRLRLIGQPVGGIYSGSDMPDLTLDQTASALKPLPQDRLGSLFLHACDLSSIESICALQDVPHHIATEEEMSSPILFHNWFQTLGNPSATANEITAKCFSSIKAGPTPKGVFSSHKTTIDSLLSHLNALGDLLMASLKKTDTHDATIAAINTANSASMVRSYTHDILRFAETLKADSRVSDDIQKTANHLISDLGTIQVSKPYSNHSNNGYHNFGGISMYLPMRVGPTFSLSSLPVEFQTNAASWLKFVELWTKVRK